VAPLELPEVDERETFEGAEWEDEALG
jgi:hypothetical protein